MKKVFPCVLLLSLILLLFPGCKKRYVGEMVSKDIGYRFYPPKSSKRIYFLPSMVVDYTLEELEGTDKYRFEGTARMLDRGASATRIASTEFRLLLIKDNTIVDNVLLHSRGVEASKPMDLYKEFELPGGFDRFGIDWYVRYYE